MLSQVNDYYFPVKKGGGGVQPTGKKIITDTTETDVAAYATAQVEDVNLVPGNIAKDITVLGVVGTHEDRKPEQTKSVTITQNGTTEVTPDSGKALSKVTVTTNVALEGALVSELESFAYFHKKGANMSVLGQYTTNNGTDFSYMFQDNTTVTSISQLNVSNGTRFMYMFNGCSNLVQIPVLDTSKGTSFISMFNGCKKLVSVNIDMNSCTSEPSLPFNNCQALENVTIKNIKVSFTLAQGDKAASGYGHNITVQSYVGICKECIKQSASKTLTIGSYEIQKIASVYVRFTDPTQTTIEVGKKGEVEQCESTDERAMLLSEYMALKSWTFA